MNTQAAYTEATSLQATSRQASSHGDTWTTERVDQLRRFITAGLTCSQIAAEIGVTRNAVIGKIHRLGLSARPPGAATFRPGPADAGRGRRPASLPRPPRSPLAQLLRAVTAGQTVVPFPSATAMTAAVESVQRCSLLELAGSGCRWPLGDPGKADFGFCGNEAIAGISYCAGHARLAYRLPSGRRA